MGLFDVRKSLNIFKGLANNVPQVEARSPLIASRVRIHIATSKGETLNTRKIFIGARDI